MHDGHIHRYHERHDAPANTHASERRTWAVVLLTGAMMVVELIVGQITGSLALLADGFHMATHVGALGLSGLAYWFARTRARDESFSFGTGKVYALAGYTSAVCLALVSIWMLVESITRLVHPTQVRFDEALPVAVLGLIVNLISAKMLGHGAAAAHGHEREHGHEHEHEHEHEHGHEHEHEHEHHHHDHNLRAAYFHVLADALTSLLAIVALLAGRYLGLGFLDPAMGIVGGLVIIRWSWGLCRAAASQLLDMSRSPDDARVLRESLELVDDVRVADLHLWDLGPGRRSCIVKLLTSAPRDTSYYRDLIQSKVKVSHLTVEVHRCDEPHGVPS